jgi:hypothetical protein
MNWIPEQKILELKEAMARNEAAQSVNILYELEREFNRVFAGDSDTELSGRRGKAGDHVKRSELSHDRKQSSE